MKLALCLFKYFPYGGLQRNFLTIAQCLQQRGHQLTIYTGRWEGERPVGMEIIELPVRGLSNHGRNKNFYRQLRLQLKNRPADLVIGFNKMPGLDVYYCADTCFATSVYEEKPWYYRLLGRSRISLAFERAVFAASSGTQVLLLSANEGEAFQRYYQTDPDRLQLMPPGISRDRVRTDDSDSKGRAMRQALVISEEEKVIVFLGSDYKRKGLGRLLHAISALPAGQRDNCRLLVIGRDKRQPDYIRLATRLGVAERLCFLGQRDDVPDLLFAADLLVHPAYLENTGNVILEAAVAGLAVLCTANCGYAFYIKDYKLGAVVPQPFLQQTMNEQLAALLASDSDWRVRGKAFADTADIFSRPLRAAQMIEMVSQKKQQTQQGAK